MHEHTTNTCPGCGAVWQCRCMGPKRETRNACHACAARTKAATPEPPPVRAGVEVTPHLIAWIHEQPLDARRRVEIVRDILARDAYGRAKYGQPLMSEDGRDHVNDARQEGYDMLQYVQAARLQGQDVSDPLPLLRLVVRMVEEAAGGVAA